MRNIKIRLSIKFWPLFLLVFSFSTSSLAAKIKGDNIELSKLAYFQLNPRQLYHFETPLMTDEQGAIQALRWGRFKGHATHFGCNAFTLALTGFTSFLFLGWLGEEKRPLTHLSSVIISSALMQFGTSDQIIGSIASSLAMGKEIKNYVAHLAFPPSCISMDSVEKYEVKLIREGYRMALPLKEKAGKVLFEIHKGEENFSKHKELLEILFNLPSHADALEFNEEKIDKAFAGIEESAREELKIFAYKQRNIIHRSLKEASIWLAGGIPGVNISMIKKWVQSIRGHPCVVSLLEKTVDDLLGNAYQPGRILRCLVDSKVTNPFIIFDATDSLWANGGAEYQTLQSHLADPRNSNKISAYLGIPYDISRISFIYLTNQQPAEANSASPSIPPVRLLGEGEGCRLAYIVDHYVPFLFESMQGSRLRLSDLKQEATAIVESHPDFSLEELIQTIEKAAYKRAIKKNRL